MPALNYKARFAPLVLAGTKRSTIRRRRKDGRDPKPGQTLYHYTGMRTKQCKHLLDTICTAVHPLTITKRGRLKIKGRCVDDHYSRLAIAYRDGFRDYLQLVTFFEQTHGLPFSGLLIEW